MTSQILIAGLNDNEFRPSQQYIIHIFLFKLYELFFCKVGALFSY